MSFKFKDRVDLKKVGLQDHCSDRGWHFGDYLRMEVIGYDKKSFDKISDDYPGAFKPMPRGEPHPTGLGTQPGTGQQSQQSSSGAKGLVVYVAATHAGLITRNNGFYMPDKMREGISTWTDIYKKPVQIHHSDDMDPVGRVISARYVDTSNIVAETYKDYVLRDSARRPVGNPDLKFWKDFCGDDKSFIQKLQMIKTMDSVLEDKHYRGVGYTVLDLDITDPDAQQKIVDGRYSTVSIGAVSDKAVCSVCDTNWLEEEHCGHRPGKVYDGKRCFVIAGKLENDEVSWVNTPADRHASVLGFAGSGAISDSVKENGIFLFPYIDNFHKEDSDMLNEEDGAKPDEKTADSVAPVDAPEDQAVDTTVKVEDTSTADLPETTQETVDTTGKTEDSAGAEEEEVTPSFADKLFSTDEASLTKEDRESLYDQVMAELSEKELKDAKLDSEALSKLPKSVFCGPDKTLPVTDKAHALATSRFLAKLEDSEAKAEAEKKLERKCKALGLVLDATPVVETTETLVKAKDSSLKISVVEELLRALDMGLYGRRWEEDDKTPAITDDEASALREMISGLVKRIGKDNFLTALAEEGLSVHQDEYDAQVQECEKLEDSLGQKVDQLTALRQELAASFADITALQDQLISTSEKLKKHKTERLKDMMILDGSFTDEIKDSFATLTDEALDSKLDLLSGKVDINKIADKVNDGFSRTPTETVENPVPTTENEPSSVEDKTNTRKPTYQTQEIVDNAYRRILLHERNPDKAEAYYAKAVKDGYAKAKG